jgi:muramoyltetrapeptide carboxypeptidase
VDAGRLGEGIQALYAAGFEVECAEGIDRHKGYLAGEPQDRAQALEALFQRDEVQAIFCARGGFGSIQLLPFLRPEILRSHPKIFVGYSDVTVLLNWLLQRCGLVSFHGPMVAMELSRGLAGRSAEFFWETLSGLKSRWQIRVPELIRPGKAEGEMVGGCLSALVTTLGTPYEIETERKILFLEDVGEKPYRIERMLTHLEMAGKLKNLAGLVLGSFTDCGGDGERGLREIVVDLFRDASYPVVGGFPAGHGEENIILPFGVAMALDGGEGTLSLLEAPLSLG